MKIDSHVHLADNDHPRGGTAAELASARQRLTSLMDAHVVSAAVLVASDPADQSVVAAATDQPARFASIGVVDLTADDAVHRARAWLDAGARGVRVRTLAQDGNPLRLLPDLLHLLEARDALLWAYVACEEWEVLDRELAGVPTLRVFINHCGFCRQCRPGNPDGLLSLLANQPTTSVMFSALQAYSRSPYPYADLHDWARQLYRLVGASRLAWASDFPWGLRSLAYAKHLDLVRRVLPDLTGDERADVMGGTIARLLGRTDWLAPDGSVE